VTRDLRQHEVAGGVAVAVVDGLEVVDVADEDAAGLAVGDRAAHRRHPVAAVEQAREVVDARLALELGDAGGHRRAGLAAADGLQCEVVEVLVAQPERLQGGAEQRVVGLRPRGQADDLVGDHDAGRLRRRDREAVGAAVVEGDRALDRLLDLRRGGDERAGGGVVDAEALALGAGAHRAGGMLGRDRVERRGAERQRHDELADVVQQAAQMGDVDVGTRALGDRLGAARYGGGVQVQMPDRAPAVAGGALEEAERGRLDRELRDRLAADEGHRGADAAGAQRPGAGGGVRVAQQVRGEALIGLQRRDHVADAGVLALGDRLHAADRGAQYGQPPELGDRGQQALLRRYGRGACRSCHMANHGSLHQCRPSPKGS
jgi:hypothetical protein